MSEHAVWGLKLGGEVQQIIETAERELWLISPYTKTQIDTKGDDLLVRAIRVALSRKVRVNMVVREAEKPGAALSPDLGPLIDAGMQLFEVENLHAKLYLAEGGALVTSLNLYAPTRNTTLDLGVVVRRGPLLDQLRNFIETQIKPQMKRVEKRSRQHRAGSVARKAREKRVASQLGSCIRCGDTVAVDLARPYCDGCYKSWSRYKNDEYEEEFCHECGYPVGDTSMRKPRCRDCWRSNPDL